MRKILLSAGLLCFFTAFASGQNTLSDYLQSAIKFSPVFIDNQNQINAISQDSLLIRATQKPQLNFTSNNYYAPVVNGYGYDEIITNGGNYNALLGVNYTIVGKNVLNNKYSALSIQKQNIELNTKLSERDLKQSVTAQFITVFGEQQILSNTNKILNVLKEEDLILKNIAEKGIYRETDYLSFLVSYKQQQFLYSQLYLQVQNDLYLLNYLCGIPDTMYVILPDPELSISQNAEHENTIQFKQLFLDSLRLANSTEQLKFNYKPKINLFGDAGYNTSFIYHAEKNFGAGIGINFSVPVYDGSQRRLQAEKLKLSEFTRVNYADYYKKQFNMKQKQLLQQIADTDKLIEDAKKQLAISETLVKANNKLLETGDTRIADYIFSLNNYITSQATIQQLITSKMLLINQYNYLNY